MSERKIERKKDGGRGREKEKVDVYEGRELDKGKSR